MTALGAVPSTPDLGAGGAEDGNRPKTELAEARLRAEATARRRAREHAEANPTLAFLGSVARLIELLEQRGPKIIRFLPLCPAEWSLLLRGGKRALKQVEVLLRRVGFENYVVSLEERRDPAWPDRSGAMVGARRWLRVMVRDPELQRITRVHAPAINNHRREGYDRIELGVRWLVAAAHASGFRLRSWCAEGADWPAHLYVSGGAAEARRLVRFLQSRGQQVGFRALMRRVRARGRRAELGVLAEFRRHLHVDAAPG